MDAADFTHDHADVDTLTFGCAGCVERVRLDQDVAYARDLEIPKRKPTNDPQIRAVVNAWGLPWDKTVTRIMRWCETEGVDDLRVEHVLQVADIERNGPTLFDE